MVSQQLDGFVKDCTKRFTYVSLNVNPIYREKIISNNKKYLADTRDCIRIEGPIDGVRKAAEKLKYQFVELEDNILRDAVVERSSLEVNILQFFLVVEHFLL